MASGYSDKFTLSDLFRNENLKGYLPQIKVTELYDEQGGYKIRTSMETIATLLLKYSKDGARPFYKKMVAKKIKRRIDISGDLQGDLKSPFEGVYNNIVSNKYMLNMALNNMNMIRYALKTQLDQKHTIGYESKLFLRLGNLDEIKGMNKQQIGFLMDDVMRNLFYNREFELTQRKFDVTKIPIEGSTEYFDKRADAWLKKVSGR